MQDLEGDEAYVARRDADEDGDEGDPEEEGRLVRVLQGQTPHPADGIRPVRQYAPGRQRGEKRNDSIHAEGLENHGPQRRGHVVLEPRRLAEKAI